MIPKLMPQAHRRAPMRHRATGIVHRYLLEFLRRFFVPERVQQGDAAFKRLLHSRRAGYGKDHSPQLCRVKIFVMMMALLVIGNGRGGKNRESNGTRKKQPEVILHTNPAEKRV